MATQSNKPPVDILSMIEQFETVTVQTAIIIASYRKALLDQGVPEDEAKALTRDYHSILWAFAFGQNK